MQDPKYITTDYEGSIVQTKPDIVLTSTVAAGDANYQLNNQPAILARDKPPEKGFKMRQILASSEFKLGTDGLTPAPASYNKTRQSEYGCNSPELFVLYPIDGSGQVVNVSITQTVDPEPPAKRIKTDVTSLATGAGPSGTSNTGSASKNGKTSKTKGSKQGSRPGATPKTETTYFPPNNSKNPIDARTQCAVYGMEMLSYATGIHHVSTFSLSLIQVTLQAASCGFGTMIDKE